MSPVLCARQIHTFINPETNLLAQIGVGARGAEDFDSLWSSIQAALSDINTKNASSISFEQLYRLCYKIVTQKLGEKLYDHVADFEQQWFATEILPKVQALVTTNLVKDERWEDKKVGNANERRMTGEKFLMGMSKVWEDSRLCMNMTTDVLMYMDRLAQANHQRPSIFNTTLGKFRDSVLRAPMEVAETKTSPLVILTSVILDMIRMEREGDVIDKTLVRGCVRLYEMLHDKDTEIDAEKLYLIILEPQFLADSRKFYNDECAKLLSNGDASIWLRETRRRLKEEEERCSTMLQGDLTQKKLQAVVQEELIKAHLQEFIDLEGTGLKGMIDNDRFEDLSLLYQHIGRIDTKKEALKSSLHTRVMEMGGAINKNILSSDSPTKNDKKDEPSEGSKYEKKAQKEKNSAAAQTEAAIRWVDEVLLLRDKFDRIMSQCFQDDLAVQSALTKSFQDIINQFDRCSEFLSLFIDSNLKNGVKARTEQEIEDVLGKATTLLNYIQDKDLFERFYKKHLARRLLHGKSESADIEKLMISRMKQVIGTFATSKLEGMLGDITTSAELSSSYRYHIAESADPTSSEKHIELGVSVLSSNNWPIEVMGVPTVSKDKDVKPPLWPKEIKRVMESFEAFYGKSHTGRKLDWAVFVGSADVKCTFPKIEGKEGALGRERRYEVNVPTVGLLVLMHFNDIGIEDSLSFEDLLELTQLDPRDLSRILAVLAVHPKAKVLAKEPASGTVKPGDKFSFNKTFHSKSIKIKAPTLATGVNKVEAGDERKQTLSKNDDDRGLVVDATIVRTMK